MPNTKHAELDILYSGLAAELDADKIEKAYYDIGIGK